MCPLEKSRIIVLADSWKFCALFSTSGKGVILIAQSTNAEQSLPLLACYTLHCISAYVCLLCILECNLRLEASWDPQSAERALIALEALGGRIRCEYKAWSCRQADQSAPAAGDYLLHEALMEEAAKAGKNGLMTDPYSGVEFKEVQLHTNSKSLTHVLKMFHTNVSALELKLSEDV